MIFKQYTSNGKRRVSNGKRHVIQRKQTRENVCGLCLSANSCTSLKANSTNNCVLLPQPTNNSDKADTQKDANVFRAAASSTSGATNTDESSDSDNESERNGYNSQMTDMNAQRMVKKYSFK